MRTTLGPRFSLAAEMLWALKTRKGLSNAQIGEIVGARASQISKILWGDLRPTVVQVARLETYSRKNRPTIGSLQWSMPWTPGFEPPTLVEARADLASADAAATAPPAQEGPPSAA